MAGTKTNAPPKTTPTGATPNPTAHATHPNGAQVIDYIDYTPDMIPPVAVATQKPWVRSEDLWPGFRAWRAWHPVGGEFVTNSWHRALRFALGDATVGV